MDFTEGSTVIGERYDVDDVLELVAVYKSQIISLSYVDNKTYSIYVYNISKTVQQRKTYNFTSNPDYLTIVETTPAVADCIVTPSVSACLKSIDRFAYSNSKVGFRKTGYNRTNNIKKFPLEVIEKYKARLPSLYELSTTVNGISYNLLSIIIVVLLLAM